MKWIASRAQVADGTVELRDGDKWWRWRDSDKAFASQNEFPCPVERASRYALRVGWQMHEEYGMVRRDVDAIVRIQPWLRFQAEGLDADLLGQQCLALFANYPNQIWNSPTDVMEADAKEMHAEWKKLVDDAKGRLAKGPGATRASPRHLVMLTVS